MREYKSLIEPAREVKRLIKIVCDICHAEIKDNGFDVDKATVTRKEGYECSDGGHIREIEYDICAKCFDTRLMPWFNEQGASPIASERDW